MRDPNKINNSDRNQWMARSLAGMKKVSDQPANPPGSKFAASAPDQQIAKAKTVQAKLTSGVIAVTKSEPEKKEPLGPIDFTGTQIARGISDTRGNRYRLGKQVARALGKSYSQNTKVINNLMSKVNSNGQINIYNAKKAIQNSDLTAGQQQRLRHHLGI